MKILCLDRAKCSGCGACEVLCSLHKRGRAQSAEARIRLKGAGTQGQYAAVCQHCAEPACMAACLKTIIRQENGRVVRDFPSCFACSACAVSCPMDAVVYDSREDAYMTCDLCGGDPLCVKVCPTGALRYEEPALASAGLRAAYARTAVGKGGLR